MDSPSLDYWIGRLNAGDPEAVERVYRAYEPYLRLAVRRRLGAPLRSRVDSGDIVQSVFADVLAGVRTRGWRFEDRAKLAAFLRRIAMRRVADRYRDRGRAAEGERGLDELTSREFPASPLPRPSQEAQARELSERILDACPPVHRQIVRMRVSGLKLAEIAERTGLHEGSVRRILYDLARRMSIARRQDDATNNETS